MKIVVRTRKLVLNHSFSVIADSVANLQILFLICLQGTCDNSSSANEANMTCDNMASHLENDEEYLRVTEVNFFYGLPDYCK